MLLRRTEQCRHGGLDEPLGEHGVGIHDEHTIVVIKDRQEIGEKHIQRARFAVPDADRLNDRHTGRGRNERRVIGAIVANTMISSARRVWLRNDAMAPRIESCSL